MDTNHLAIIVQGLFEKSDSIGYDAVFEYTLLKEVYGISRVRIFAEKFDQNLYDGIPIAPISEYWDYLENTPAAITIYHYCDGWGELDAYIQDSERKFIVRWHNNTPPWFYGVSHRRSVERTIGGFRTILKFIACKNVKFWVNSNFTLDQLRVLGADLDQAAVVYPGSRFLAASHSEAFDREVATQISDVAKEDRPIKLLFVSRVVAHKGHRHVVAFAGALQHTLSRNVSVTFIGRDDPATSLKSDLAQLGVDEDVEVLLMGEVSEKDLRAAYADADIFVCFSEHEGFGMPVFEAMRVGVPVICWGRTALRELMEHHPFMLDHLDFAQAISAVRLIESGEVRADLQTIQQLILETYTSQVIAKQLKAAIDGKYGFWSGDASHFDEIVQIKDTLKEKQNQQIVDIDRSARQPHEAGENFVTVYDIDSYEALLSFDRGIERLPAHEAPADFILFSHREFVTTRGHRLADGIVFSAAAQDKTHVIFGPYETFVRGYFAADFELEVEQNGNPAVELQLDVAIEGGVISAKRRMTVKQFHAGETPRLLFPISSENAVVEFRIQVRKTGNCNFMFKGVTVRNMRQSLVGLCEEVKIPLFDMRWFKKNRLQPFKGLRISFLAKSHFMRADRLRDREWWNDAADAYAEGLNYDPSSFSHFVQLGNCLKEASRFEESEAAYQRALTIQPEDQDAHLQIGRLYRFWDKPEEANYHFLKAVGINRTAAEAMLELSEDGFNLTSLPMLFG